MLAPGEERSQEEREQDTARDSKTHGRFRDRQEEHLADGRVELVGVVEDDVGSYNRGVERECREPERRLGGGSEVAPGEEPEDGRSAREDCGDDPGVGLIARRIAARENADFDGRERDGDQANQRDPAFRLADAVEVARHRVRRSAAQRACSLTSSSELSAWTPTASISAGSPEFPAATS